MMSDAHLWVKVSAKIGDRRLRLIARGGVMHGCGLWRIVRSARMFER